MKTGGFKLFIVYREFKLKLTTARSWLQRGFNFIMSFYATKQSSRLPCNGFKELFIISVPKKKQFQEYWKKSQIAERISQFVRRVYIIVQGKKKYTDMKIN